MAAGVLDMGMQTRHQPQVLHLADPACHRVKLKLRMSMNSNHLASASGVAAPCKGRCQYEFHHAYKQCLPGIALWRCSQQVSLCKQWQYELEASVNDPHLPSPSGVAAGRSPYLMER